MVKTIVFTILSAILLLTREVACGQCVDCWSLDVSTTVIKHPSDTCKAEITMEYTLGCLGYTFTVNSVQIDSLAAHGCLRNLVAPYALFKNYLFISSAG